MMTYTQFVNATRLSIRKDARGPNILPIDSLVLEYDHALEQNANDGEKIAILCKIIKTCKDWLRLKRKTKGNPTNMEQSDYTRRYAKIQELANQALDELFKIDENLKLASERYQLNKSQYAGKFQLQSLSGGYGNERLHYVLSNKQGVASGKDITENALNRAKDMKLPKGIIIKEETKAKHLAITAARTKTFGQLTAEEYMKIASVANAKQVKFFSKLERLRLMAWVNGEGRLTDYQEVELQGDYMYAIDRYGNILVHAIPKGHEIDGKNLNHSSFAAGNDVVCAGAIRADRGALLSISNNSGHYKPTREHLLSAINLLGEQYMVDLSGCSVFYSYAGVRSDMKGTFNATFLSVEKFKADQPAVPPAFAPDM